MSTNHKDIGSLYFIFGLFSGIIGTLLPLIRLELALLLVLLVVYVLLFPVARPRGSAVQLCNLPILLTSASQDGLDYDSFVTYDATRYLDGANTVTPNV